MPVLRFQCISVTGAGFTDRQELERRIEALGGKYSGQLDKNKTTMLLCDVRTASPQYRHQHHPFVVSMVHCEDFYWQTMNHAKKIFF